MAGWAASCTASAKPSTGRQIRIMLLRNSFPGVHFPAYIGFAQDPGGALIERSTKIRRRYDKKIGAMLQRCCLLILTCVAASGFQGGGGSPSDASRRADVYAIYSLLLANAPLSHPGDNQVYLVAGTTVPGVPREPCVRPPDEYAAGFAEIMADYGKRKNVAVILQPRFQLD